MKPTEVHHQWWPVGSPKTLFYPVTAVSYNFEVSAARYPDKPCFIFYGHITTYAQAWQQVCKLAAWLQNKAGVVRGDRVLLDVQNSPQFIIAYYAILHAGGMVVPVNPMSKSAELAHYFNDSGARTAIVAQDVLQWFTPLLSTTPLQHVVVVCYGDYVDPQAGFNLPDFIAADPLRCDQVYQTAWSTIMQGQWIFQAIKIRSEDYSVLPYTSGSTGNPKGCTHTHRSVMAATMMSAWWKNSMPDSVVLATAPFFHVTGMVNSMHAAIYKGCSIVILPRWDAVNAAALIERYRCTVWTNVPTMVVDVLSNPACAAYDLSSLASITGGGAAMPAAIAQKLSDQYKLTYIEGYGMTEFMAATHVNPPDRAKKQCLGIPIFDTYAQVIDPDTLQPLGPNVQGEIVMAGPQQMTGYWNEPEQTLAALVQIDGITYFRSGDLGYKDDDGYYFISDRLKRMINASGFKVWPAEVENFFYQHPAIKECCIIASPDERKGEVVKLVAVVKEGVTQPSFDEMNRWARDQMANYKVPAIIQWCDALPRTSSGKIFWRQLQDQAWGRA